MSGLEQERSATVEAGIALIDVEKVYDGGTHAVRGLDLRVDPGELMVLLGPSGCGKSTVLRMVAGLESPTSGEIHVAGRRVDGLAPRDRDVAMVFQSYALYGHMTVRENLEFPLRMQRVGAAERKRRSREVAEMLELGPLLDAKPGELSGGQQQRVAMGRALVREPAAFLLDEPLSNLDARLRGHVRANIAEVQARLGVTTLYVTHDQLEAMSLGDRVAVLRDGRLCQVGPGGELYARPADTFVAQFLGHPGMNLIEGSVTPDGRVSSDIHGSGTVFEVAGSWFDRSLAGRQVVLGVRPEDWGIVAVGSDVGDFDDEGPPEDVVHGIVRTIDALGAERVLHLAAQLTTLDATAPVPVRGEAGDSGPALAVRVPSEAGTHPKIAPGTRVAVRPRADRARLFGADGLVIATR